MMPWTLAAVALYRLERLGVRVASDVLARVRQASRYCAERAVAEFARELDDCCQVAESARGNR